MIGGLASQIVGAWLDLRASYRRIAGLTEAQGLALVMLACFLLFVAGLPALSANPLAADPEIGFSGLLAGRLVATLLMAPLLFYLIGGLSHVLSRAVGGAGTYRGARLALFWALLVAAPLELARAAAMALVLPASAAPWLASLVGALFLWAWASFLSESEGFDRTPVAVIMALPLVPFLITNL